MFIYLAQELLFVTGVVTARVGFVRLPRHISGALSNACAAGVRDRFQHLDGSVLMNILIISLNAGACWVAARPPLPEINMGTTRLRRESTPAGGVESLVMHLLALMQPMCLFV